MPTDVRNLHETAALEDEPHAASRRAVGHVLGLAPIRAITLVIVHAARLLERVASKARCRALVPHAADAVVHWTVEMKYPERIAFGQRVIVGPHCTLGAAAPITLGDHVRLSKGVVVETAGLDFSGPPPYPHIAAAIHLERGVWVGAGAMILGGVRIGEYSIIGAGAVVSRDVPARSIVTGAPMRVRPQETA